MSKELARRIGRLEFKYPVHIEADVIQCLKDRAAASSDHKRELIELILKQRGHSL